VRSAVLVVSVRYKAAQSPLRKADDGTNRSSSDARLEGCDDMPSLYSILLKDQSAAMKSPTDY
jgi:hypothetical protein